MRVHLNLDVRDLTRSVAFYGTLFGTMPSKLESDYANWRLDAPGLHLALVHKPQHEPAETDQHFGIEIMDDDALFTWRDRVKAAGIDVRVEEAVTCCYAVANKFWVTDPDGNDWEFWVKHEDADAMHGDTASTDAGCCAPPTKATMPLATAVQTGTDCGPSDAPC